MTIPENALETILIPVVTRLIGAIIVLLVFRGLAGWVKSGLKRGLAKTALIDSMITLLSAIAYYGVLILGFIMALAILGVPMTTLVTGIGLIVVVFGIALRESLGNFAATVIFLLFRPFEVGDVIETCGRTGMVKEIEIFNTVLHTAEQKVVVLPNAKIQGDGITNYSKLGILRADMVFGIGYGEDIVKARQIIEELIAADERILAEPKHQIVVLELADSSVNIGVRPFVKLEDYFNVPSDFNERVKLRFDEMGIKIPHPQRDVHLIQSNGQV